MLEQIFPGHMYLLTDCLNIALLNSLCVCFDNYNSGSFVVVVKLSLLLLLPTKTFLVRTCLTLSVAVLLNKWQMNFHKTVGGLDLIRNRKG